MPTKFNEKQIASLIAAQAELVNMDSKLLALHKGTKQMLEGHKLDPEKMLGHDLQSFSSRLKSGALMTALKLMESNVPKGYKGYIPGLMGNVDIEYTKRETLIHIQCGAHEGNLNHTERRNQVLLFLIANGCTILEVYRFLKKQKICMFNGPLKLQSKFELETTLGIVIRQDKDYRAHNFTIRLDGHISIPLVKSIDEIDYLAEV